MKDNRMRLDRNAPESVVRVKGVTSNQTEKRQCDAAVTSPASTRILKPPITPTRHVAGTSQFDSKRSQSTVRSKTNESRQYVQQQTELPFGYLTTSRLWNSALKQLSHKEEPQLQQPPLPQQIIQTPSPRSRRTGKGSPRNDGKQWNNQSHTDANRHHLTAAQLRQQISPPPLVSQQKKQSPSRKQPSDQIVPQISLLGRVALTKTFSPIQKHQDNKQLPSSIDVHSTPVKQATTSDPDTRSQRNAVVIHQLSSDKLVKFYQNILTNRQRSTSESLERFFRGRKVNNHQV